MNRIRTQFAIPQEKRTGTALLILAIFFGILAQSILLLATTNGDLDWNVARWFSNIGNNSSPVLGLGLYMAAGILLVFGVQKLDVNIFPNYRVAAPQISKPAPTFGLWITSLSLAGIALNYTSQPQLAEQNGFLVSSLWVLSIALFVISVLRQAGWRFPRLSSVTSWISANRFELLGILLLLALAATMRLLDVEIHPYSMVNDEGEMGKGALCLLQQAGSCPNIFTIAWASQPLVAYLPYALSVSILGNTAAFPIRLVSVVTGVLSVLFTYLFVRETFDKKVAWVAGILLCTFPYHLHFSRLGVDNIVDSLSSALLLWLIFRGMRKGTIGYFLAAGIVAGLGFYTYPGSRLTAGIGIGALIYAILTQRNFLRTQAGNLLAFFLVMLITLAPLAGTYKASGDEFNARMNAVGIFQTGAMDAQMQETGMNAAQILTREFFKSFLPFIATSGPMNFFNTPRAYLSALAAMLLMLGLALALRKMFDLRNTVLLAWFFAPIIFGSTLTAGAPSNQRMLGSSPAAVILAALALVAIIQGLQNINGILRWLAPVIMLAALLFNGYLDINFYFGEYRSGLYFEDLSNEITYESRLYTQPLGADGRFYFIGAPMTFTFFGNFGYFLPNVEMVDFNDVTPETITALPKDKDALFIAIPYREPDLKNISTWLPGGEWITENRRYLPEEPLFFVYKVSKEQLQAIQP